jgi:hypothetical protein
VVLQANTVKLVRTVELADTSHDEILGVLFPTMAFIEDQFHAKPGRVLFCGMGYVDAWEAELGVPVEVLKSRFGTPNQFNAGLHGYLQSVSSERAGASAA